MRQFKIIFVLSFLFCKIWSQSIIFDANQLEILVRHIERLLRTQSKSFSKDVSLLSAALIDNQIKPISKIYTEVLSVLKDAELFKERFLKNEDVLLKLQANLNYLTHGVNQLKKDSKKCKRDIKLLHASSKSILSACQSQKNILSVFFDAVRYEDFKGPGNLTYESSIVNEGSGLSISDGIFTAPTKGFYFFEFHANTVTGDDALVLFRRNGEAVAGSYDTDNFNRNTISQSCIVLLKERDLFWIDIIHGGIRSNQNVYVHFVGMLIK